MRSDERAATSDELRGVVGDISAEHPDLHYKQFNLLTGTPLSLM
jgi:hypothetical protein